MFDRTWYRIKQLIPMPCVALRLPGHSDDVQDLIEPASGATVELRHEIKATFRPRPEYRAAAELKIYADRQCLSPDCVGDTLQVVGTAVNPLLCAAPGLPTPSPTPPGMALPPIDTIRAKLVPTNQHH